MVNLPEAPPAVGQLGRPLRIGYVPLIDCAPLVVAEEEGLFSKYGVEVRLSPEPGWASIREKIIYRELDAAQCLSGLVLALHYGLGCLRQPVIVPMVLNANGNGITLSKDIPPEVLQQPEGLRNHLQTRSPSRPFTMATVHPYSSHNILLRDWLRRQGLHPDRDAEIVFLPPAVIPRNLAADTIDGYCVGEPWNSHAIAKGTGWCAATSVDLANGHPEKVLAVSKIVQRERPEEILGLTAALLEACRLCADPNYRNELTSLLSRPEFLNTPEPIVRNSLSKRFQTGNGDTCDLPNLHLFFGNDINAPTMDKANWVISGMRQAGLLQDIRLSSLSTLYRPDLYEAALTSLPESSSPAQLHVQ